MPQLPSGKHVGVTLDPLNKLINDILENQLMTCAPLLRINQMEDLYPYLNIVYFENETDSDTPGLEVGSLPLDAELKPVFTNYRVTDVLSKESEWDGADKEAFINFLESERFNKMHKKKFESVLELKEILEKEGSWLNKAEFQMWKGGFHWEQDEEF